MVVGELLEEIIKNESEDELERLTVLFLHNERTTSVDIHGYVEEVVGSENLALCT